MTLDEYIKLILDDRAKALDAIVENFLETFKLTLEEFSKEYTIELYPLEIETVTFSDVYKPDEYKFEVIQKYRIRRKTEEEKEYDESQLNQVSSLEDSGSDGSATSEVRS